MLVVILAGLENEEEEAKVMEAHIEISRSERGGRKTQDLKMFLDNENVLLRKVWRNLEKVCRQEGIRRFQIEAKSKVSPIKKKIPSELEKAKEKVQIRLEKERQKAKDVEDAQSRLKKTLCDMVKEWCNYLQFPKFHDSQLLAITYVVENSASNMLENHKEMSAPREEEVIENITLDVGSNSKVQEEAEDTTEDEAEQGVECSSRLKKAKWLPPDGWRRCGKGCAGCASKCVDQGLEDCQGCFLNNSRSVNSNSCLNREACVNLKEQKDRRTRSSHKKGMNNHKKPSPLDAARSPAVTTKVNSQVVVSKPEFVKDTVGALEEREDKKRNREETGKTPEQEKKMSKIALPVRKVAGGKEPLAGQL